MFLVFEKNHCEIIFKILKINFDAISFQLRTEHHNDTTLILKFKQHCNYYYLYLYVIFLHETLGLVSIRVPESTDKFRHWASHFILAKIIMLTIR